MHTAKFKGSELCFRDKMTILACKLFFLVQKQVVVNCSFVFWGQEGGYFAKSNAKTGWNQQRKSCRIHLSAFMWFPWLSNSRMRCDIRQKLANKIMQKSCRDKYENSTYLSFPQSCFMLLVLIHSTGQSVRLVVLYKVLAYCKLQI